MSAGPGPKPDLVIPMRFDGAEALKMIEKLRAAGKDAGGALDDAGRASKGLGDNIAGVISTQGYQMLKDGAQALAAGYKEAADYIKSISAEFIQQRDLLQQVAALKGVQNTGDFTVKQARAAEAASLRPEEWAKFQEQFQSYAGAFIAGDQAKMTDGQSESYQKRLAQFAKARGISADQVAQLGGGVLQFADGPIDDKEAMKRFGRAFATLERSPTPVPQLLPQMTRVMAQGANTDQAAQLLSLMSLGMPGEEETGVTNVMKAIDKALVEGKGAELGVTEDMNPLEKAKAAAFAIKRRVDAGESQIALEKEYFADIREKKGFRTLITQGIDRGGFDRVAGYVNDTPADFTDKAVADYEKSDAGKFARARAGLAASRIERGDQYKQVEQARLEAERQLTKEGRFEEYEFGDVSRFLASKLTAGFIPDAKTQLINERAVSNAFQRAQATGALSDSDVFALGRQGQTGQGMTDLGANNTLLKLIQAQNEMMTRDQQKPLAAPPANPALRPQ